MELDIEEYNIDEPEGSQYSSLQLSESSSSGNEGCLQSLVSPRRTSDSDDGGSTIESDAVFDK